MGREHYIVSPKHKRILAVGKMDTHDLYEAATAAARRSGSWHVVVWAAYWNHQPKLQVYRVPRFDRVGFEAAAQEHVDKGIRHYEQNAADYREDPDLWGGPDIAEDRARQAENLAGDIRQCGVNMWPYNGIRNWLAEVSDDPNIYWTHDFRGAPMVWAQINPAHFRGSKKRRAAAYPVKYDPAWRHDTIYWHSKPRQNAPDFAAKGFQAEAEPSGKPLRAQKWARYRRRRFKGSEHPKANAWAAQFGGLWRL